MTIWQRIAREPAAAIGIVSAAYGAAVVFGLIAPTAEQTGALAILGGALVGGLRWIVTPSSEVIVQQVSADEPTIAGAGLGGIKTGDPVIVDIAPDIEHGEV